jgi:small subunit ribosomal protein S2
MSYVNLQDMFAAGMHFGHNASRWNPKMSKFIHSNHNGVHIINLQKSLPMFNSSLDKIKKVIVSGGRVLFVGTKKQASDIVAEYAKKCGQYYINYRWLGGMLTNWKTVSLSINTLDKINKKIEEGMVGLTKKEQLQLTRERDKLEKSLGGIKKMGGIPDVIFVIDTSKEQIAIKEAKKLGIPVVGIVDTNGNPFEIDYPVPGNDDAIKAIEFYCDVVSSVILSGIKEELSGKNVDLGESLEIDNLEEVPMEFEAESVVELEKDNTVEEIEKKD